ncbi:MAG: hypothetical protein D6718_05160 [Acidobacteria bacterium]|nr:MAG: hypothetical protein D6718_05160 [Acidobacteriota bacterium]
MGAGSGTMSTVMPAQQNPLLKEYLDILLRRRWWIIVPAVVGVLCSIALFFWSDKLYRARTRVQIRPQTISRNLLSPIVEIDSTDLVTTITAEITSEKYVQEVEDELHLIGTPGGPKNLEDLAKRLDRRISLVPNKKNNYFDLSVTWEDPRIAASIANELAAIYIRRNAEIRQRMAEETLGKLRENREQIERQLYDIRARIHKFRSEHKFELESYQKTNQDILQNNRVEIERIDAQIRDFKDKIRDLELQLEVPPAKPDAVADPRVARLREARRRREELLGSGYKEAHPSVAALTREIARLERELGLAPGEEPAVPEGESLQLQQIANEKARLQREIAVLEKKREQLVAENEEIERRLERTPDFQIQLDKLLHIEEALQEQYQEARAKELDAEEGAAVEEFKQGERFEILNMARPPSEPFWPDLKLFIFMGLAVGGGVGIGLVLLLEVFDQSFKSEEQLAAAIDLPILAVIPDLERAAERRRTRRTVTRAAG